MYFYLLNPAMKIVCGGYLLLNYFPPLLIFNGFRKNTFLKAITFAV